MIPHSKPTIKFNDLSSIVNVVKSNMISAGEKVKEFKKNFGDFIEKEYIFLYSSGTAALYDLLKSLGIGKNDDILIPAYICSSVQKAILKIGANPVYYDNEKDSWISSYNQIKKSITSNTKAIIVNHTFGIRYEENEIKRLKEIGIPLIEDNAHFISNAPKDIQISNLFIASFYSFHATKLLTTGEGGAIATNDPYLAKIIEQNKLDEGINDISAALGISQLKRYNEFLSKRLEIANEYLSAIPGVKRLDSIYFRFPILTDKVEEFLKSKLVAFRRGVDKVLKNLPNVEEVYNKTISIPIYPSLTKDEIQIIINETIRILGGNK